jgi:hypothetical protein
LRKYGIIIADRRLNMLKFYEKNTARVLLSLVAVLALGVGCMNPNTIDGTNAPSFGPNSGTTLTELSLDENPAQVTYLQGTLTCDAATGAVSGVNTAGLILSLVYSDGSISTLVAPSCFITTNDKLDSNGNKTLVLHYSGKTVDYPVVITDRAVSVREIFPSTTSLTLQAGASARLHAYPYPADATNPACLWRSSDKTVAIVDSAGRVTALAPGRAIITARSEDGGKTASTVLTVNALADASLPILTTPPKSNATYKVGETATPLSLTARVNDGGAVTYQWFRQVHNVPMPREDPIIGAPTTDSIFTPPTTHPGVYYYYAVATNTQAFDSGATTAWAMCPSVRVEVVADKVYSAAHATE